MIVAVIKTDETKNMLNFTSLLTGENICVMKTDFIKAIEKFKIWREHQGLTDFTSQLFCLMCRADENNRLKFLKGFPVEMIIYLLWYYSNSEEEFFETWGNIQIRDSEIKGEECQQQE